MFIRIKKKIETLKSSCEPINKLLRFFDYLFNFFLKQIFFRKLNT